MNPIVIGITGASGIILGLRLLKTLIELNETVALVISKDACLTATLELGKEFLKPQHFIDNLSASQKKKVTLYAIQDFTAPIASGSFLTKGMCIAPCSMATLAAVATGFSDNLIRRAADVTLKERRPLIIVPREAPLNQIHLEHMSKLSSMGAIIHPPVPAWYMKPKSLDEMEQFMVNRIIDTFNIKGHDYNRYS